VVVRGVVVAGSGSRAHCAQAVYVLFLPATKVQCRNFGKTVLQWAHQNG